MLNKIWTVLDGKKTLLGLFAGAAYLFLVHLHLIDRNPATEDVILGWLSVGLGHKVVKG
jgi:hypothetical protein